MSPRDKQAGAVGDGRLVDNLDQRFARAMTLRPADQITRDLDRLERAWRRYVRQHPPPMSGQPDPLQHERAALPGRRTFDRARLAGALDADVAPYPGAGPGATPLATHRFARVRWRGE